LRLDKQKIEVQEVVASAEKAPAFKKLGIEPPKAVLLYVLREPERPAAKGLVQLHQFHFQRDVGSELVQNFMEMRKLSRRFSSWRREARQ
jgi:ATP-dependent 26S proteasome regulatory subunit